MKSFFFFNISEISANIKKSTKYYENRFDWKNDEKIKGFPRPVSKLDDEGLNR